MTSYLAIIKDSFREALASRVLWVVLLLITVVLVALIPIHWFSTVGARLDARDIRNVSYLVPELEKGREPDATPLQKKLWDSLSRDTRKVFDEITKQGERGPFRYIAKVALKDDFNRLIETEGFYQPELWTDVTVPTRLEELLAQQDLTPELKQLRNRLALEAALPGQLRECPEEAMKFGYAWWDMTMLPAVRRSQAKDQIEFVVHWVTTILVGYIGVFVAVLITAPIIPNMLRSGSLNLLLSKPVSRPMLFLAKFAGGCSFVFINICYLIFGIYLILGFRFEFWNPRLLWTIPLFLFTFAIFYAVSALTGLLSRNTVLAIAITVLFWGFCFGIGQVRRLMKDWIIVPDQITHLLPSEDQLFVNRGRNGFGRWDVTENKISPIMQSNDPEEMMMGSKRRLADMVYDEKNQALFALQREWSQSFLASSLGANNWRREDAIPAPKNSVALFFRNGKPTVVADLGVYEVSLKQVGEPLSDINIFGLKIPAPARKDGQHKISDGVGRLSSDAMATHSKADDRIYVLNGGKLQVLAPEDGVFKPQATVETEFSDVTNMRAGKGIVVLVDRAEDANTLHVLDGENLSEKTKITPSETDRVRGLSVSAAGDWISVLTDNDKLTLFDLSNDGTEKSVRGSWSAATINGDSLVAANQHDKIVMRSIGDLTIEKTINPTVSVVKKAYRLAVDPLYLICPKPAALQNTMRYALTGKETLQQAGGFRSAGRARTVKLNPWQPIYSNTAFIAVMLSIGCLYVYRKDF